MPDTSNVRDTIFQFFTYGQKEAGSAAHVRDTFIEIFGLRIMEPMAVLTDFVVSVICLYCYYQLKPLRDKKGTFLWYYAAFFQMMALTTFLGGLLGHAFLDRISIYWKLPGWISSMIAIGFAERASILHANALISKKVGNFFAWMNIVELAFFMSITFITLKFIYVEMHVIYGLLIVMFSFETFVNYKTKDPGSRILQYGIGVAAITGYVHLSKLSIHKWFNFLDIAHLLMGAALFIIYRGVKKMYNYNVVVAAPEAPPLADPGK